MKQRSTHCGGRRGKRRLRRGHLYRASPVLPAMVPAPSDPCAVVDDLAGALRELEALPPPWDPDIDNPIRDTPGGPVVAGEWTGKIYTGHRGSWCTYLDGEDGYQTVRIVLALCTVRNALPELIRLARLGASAEAKAKARGGGG